MYNYPTKDVTNTDMMASDYTFGIFKLLLFISHHDGLNLSLNNSSNECLYHSR